MSKLIKIILFVIVMALAFIVGDRLAIVSNKKVDKKAVSFRVEVPKKFVDYEMLSMINFAAYLFEKNGFRVKDVVYGGDLYSKKIDNTYVNVFVRGYAQGIDKRISDDRIDIYLVHKFNSIYLEEFRNYDYYLSVNSELADAIGFVNSGKVSLLPIGGVKRELLKPNYEYDVLYIYEKYDEAIKRVLDEFGKYKIYDGFDFGKLSQKERESELSKAKIVLYVSNFEEGKGKRYIPFAVYDIISYGRPVMTNNNIVKNDDMIDIFDSINMLRFKLKRMLQGDDNKRENRAKEIRYNLLKKKYKSDIFAKIKH